MNVKLLPYTAIDGISTLADSELMALYDRMESDGTASTVFSNGDISDAGEFLAAMKGRNNLLYVIYVNDEESGIIWLNRFEARFARCHWCLFSNQWGNNSVEIGTQVLQIIMNQKYNDEYVYDLLLGIVPSSNKRAIKYCEECGGVIQGVIPCSALSEGKSVDGTVIYYRRPE